MNDFYTYQIIIFGFSAIQILKNFWKLIKKKSDLREFIVAFLIWFAFALFGLFPNFSTVIANLFGFQLGINFLLVLAVLFLIFLTIKQNLENDKMNNTITKLVRFEAIEKFKKDNNLDK